MSKHNVAAIVVGLLVVYAAVPALAGSSNFVLGIIINALIIAGIAVAWSLLANLGGMISFGHAAFFGIGSYASAIFAMRFGVSPLFGLVLGGVFATIASFAMLPVLRLRGAYFALAILAYAAIFEIIAVQLPSVTGGAGGLLNIPALPTVAGIDLGSRLASYFVIASLVILALVAYALIRRSTYGLALRAMHETEDATRVLGVPATRLKAYMLMVSAFITGVIGAFNAHFIKFLDPAYAFGSDWTILPIIAAIFGGNRTLGGPVLGALAIYLLDQLWFKTVIPTGHQIIVGVLLVVMILASPTGLVGLFASWWQRRRQHA